MLKRDSIGIIWRRVQVEEVGVLPGLEAGNLGSGFEF